MQQKQLIKWLLTVTIFLCSLNFASAITTTWQGTVDSDWTNALNWNNGVPTAADDARIIPSPNDPEINGTNEKAMSLVVRDGAVLTITGTGKLTVELSAANGVVIRDGGEVVVDDGQLLVKNANNNGLRIADGTLTVNAAGQVKSNDAGANGIVVADDGTVVNDGDVQINNAGGNGIRNVVDNVPAGLIDYSGAGTWKIDVTGNNGILNFITQTPDGEINFEHDGTLKIVEAGTNGIFNHIEDGTGEINFTSNEELTIKSPADFTNGSGINNYLEANSNSEINFENNAPITITLGSNSNHGIYNNNQNTGSSGLSMIDFDANADITIKDVGGKGIYNFIAAIGPGGAPTANGIRFIFSALLKIKDTGGHGMDNYAQSVGYKRIFITGEDDSNLEIINAGGRGILNQAFSSNGSVGQGHIRISLNGTSLIKNPISRGIDSYGDSGGRIWVRNQGVMTINGGTAGLFNETFNGNVEILNLNEAEWYVKNTSGNSIRSLGNGGATRRIRNAGCAYMEVDNKIFTDNFLFLNQGILKTTFNGNNNTLGAGFPGEFRNNGVISDPDGVFDANPNGLTGGGVVQTDMPNIDVEISSMGSFMFCAGSSVDLAAGEFKILPNTYMWSTTETTQSIEVTAAGVYTVTVTDDNGCTGTGTTSVTEKPLPIPAFTGNTLNDRLLVCSEEMGVVYRLKDEDPDNKGTYGGAFPKYDNYVWSVTGGTISNKGGATNRSAHVDWPVGPALGSVYVTVTDDKGCTAATSVAVTISAPVMPTVTGTFEYCAGGSTVIDAGMYAPTPNTYAWSDGATTQTLEVSSPGIYTVTVTNDDDCSGTATVDITENALPIPVFTNGTLNNSTLVCSEEMDSKYKIRNEDLDNKGTYNGGFPKYDDYAWNVSSNGTISSGGGATQRTTFVDWGVGPDMGGVYVTVTDDNGCVAATSVAVTISAPVMPTVTGTFEYCAGSSTVIDAGMYAPTPNTYVWSGGATTQTLEVSSPGIYTVTVTNDDNCTGTATVDITENALPVPAFDNLTLNESLLVCSEEKEVRYALKREVLGSGGTYGGTEYDDYQWAVDNGTISGKGGATDRAAEVDWTVGPDMGGVYVTVTDANGCIAATSVGVTISAPVMPTVTGTFEYCAGSSTVIDAGMYAPTPNTYVWSGGATTQTLEVSSPGIYTVTVTNDDNCTGTATVDITENALPVPLFNDNTLDNSLLVCSEAEDVEYKLKKEVLGSGGVYGGGASTKYADYQWVVDNGTVSGAGGATQRKVKADWPVGPDMGAVLVTVTDDNGCVASTSVAVTVRAPLMPTITGDFEICPANPAFLDAGAYEFEPNTYMWSSSETTQTISTSVEGIYTVTVTDLLGCTGTATAETTDICVPFVTGLAHNGDTMCPGDDVVATVVDSQTSAFGHDYTLTYVLFHTNNLDATTFYDSNDTGVFTAPPAGDYKICAYNELTDCQPDPSPNTSDVNSLNDVGTTTDGCYAMECMNFTVPEPFEFDFDNAELNTNVAPNGMNVYTIDICGGTPPYSLEFSSSPVEIFASVTQMYAGVNCRTIRVQYGDGAEWSLTVEDSRDCSDGNSVVTYQDVVPPILPLRIEEFASTNESRAGQNDGSASIEVSGGSDIYGEYTYEWTGPNTSITVSGSPDGNEMTDLSSGIYTVVVTDGLNNSQTITGVVRRDARRGRGRRGKTAELETDGLFLNVAPNPFADFATIQFVTAVAENASVDVYGMNGQHVANLFEGQTTAESLQSVTFDGGTLQAGTYIVRLLTESGDLQYQKVVLMR